MDFQKDRQELEELVIENKNSVNKENIKELLPGLSFDEEGDWLIEIVRSQSPYKILEKCFTSTRLSLIANALGIDPDQPDLEGRQLLSAILEKYNFTSEVTPSGITEIQLNLNNYLNAAGNLTSSTSISIPDTVAELRSTIKEVLETIFLFYTYHLTREEGTKFTWFETEENGQNIKREQEVISTEIETLHRDYCTKPKTLKSYVSYIHKLGRAIEEDREVLHFHRRFFRRDTPLNLDQLHELYLFVAYRNIIEHKDDPHNTYQKNEKDVTGALRNMSSPDRKKEWEDNWEIVVNQYQQESSFPLNSMVKRMSDFTRTFLSELCREPRVYPKVIVMRSQKFDDYNTHKITAVDDSGERVFFTDHKFEPFVEFYYHSLTTGVGIEPLLVSKEELENWRRIKMRFVVSTIGTSILTNLICAENPEEATWRQVLSASANLQQGNLTPEIAMVIDTLAERALAELQKDDVETNRLISAELNGIYGIYEGRLPNNSPDQHFLICTDTAQGQQTGKLIKDFLESHFNVEIVTPRQLSAENTTLFATGTKDLIQWLGDQVSWRRESGNEVIFNLVGGFKSLQGYMQTFGAFYADEIVYIFERSSDLIRIPRLPIQIDTTVTYTYRKEFSAMASGKSYQRSELSDDIPETLLEFLEEDDEDTDTGLSAWGVLLWNETIADLLENDTDTAAIRQYSVQFALMDAGKLYLISDPEITGVPEALLEERLKSGRAYVERSTWGKRVWDHAKSDVLGSIPPLNFPHLQYRNDFLKDIKRYLSKLLNLQETLAKISVALQNSGGNTSEKELNRMLGSGKNFEKFTGHNRIYTFRDGRDFRVSYEVDNGTLILRRYGTEPEVNRNP